MLYSLHLNSFKMSAPAVITQATNFFYPEMDLNITDIIAQYVPEIVDYTDDFETSIRQMFKKILDMAFTTHPQTHLTGIFIPHPHLSEDLRISYRPIAEITEDLIMKLIQQHNLDETQVFKFKFYIICLCDDLKTTQQV